MLPHLPWGRYWGTEDPVGYRQGGGVPAVRYRWGSGVQAVGYHRGSGDPVRWCGGGGRVTRAVPGRGWPRGWGPVCGGRLKVQSSDHYHYIHTATNRFVVL